MRPFDGRALGGNLPGRRGVRIVGVHEAAHAAADVEPLRTRPTRCTTPAATASTGSVVRFSPPLATSRSAHGAAKQRRRPQTVARDDGDQQRSRRAAAPKARASSGGATRARNVGARRGILQVRADAPARCAPGAATRSCRDEDQRSSSQEPQRRRHPPRCGSAARPSRRGCVAIARGDARPTPRPPAPRTAKRLKTMYFTGKRKYISAGTSRRASG